MPLIRSAVNWIKASQCLVLANINTAGQRLMEWLQNWIIRQWWQAKMECFILQKWLYQPDWPSTADCLSADQFGTLWIRLSNPSSQNWHQSSICHSNFAHSTSPTIGTGINQKSTQMSNALLSNEEVTPPLTCSPSVCLRVFVSVCDPFECGAQCAAATKPESSNHS